MEDNQGVEAGLGFYKEAARPGNRVPLLEHYAHILLGFTIITSFIGTNKHAEEMCILKWT